MNDDLISRQAAIDALDFEIVHMTAYCDGKNEGNPLAQYNKGLEDGKKAIKALPTVQPELTDEQAIAHLQSSGWMQRHDKEMYESGLREQLADDSDSYDSLLPSAQPEPHWIPVSERLPEKGGEYLVSVHHTIGAISVFHPEKDTYVDDVAIMKYYGKFPSTVRAWMPLPEAYKPNK